MTLDRRRFLLGSAAAAASLPWWAGCANVAAVAVSPAFRHGVASGDPLTDRVILWTRVTPPPGSDRPVPVRWRVARDPDLARPVAAGSAVAGPARDFTVKVDAGGLEPGSTFYYGFEAFGHRSPTGRTRTLPGGRPARLRLAVCSCASLPWGFFNAYAGIARRADLDAVVHLGDYLYEHANGTFGDGTALGRIPEPDREIVTLADYRTRHAQYKRDPDLQEVHRQHPFIAVWDDHEIANNAWRDGAQNHQREEGDWGQRRRNAVRAYLEWMPIREGPADTEGRIYRRFRFGDLADLIMLDTRLIGRDRPLRPDEPDFASPDRSLLGRDQERWLEARLGGSRREGVAWRVLGQQVMLATLRDESGRIANPDAWDGYPASQAALHDLLRRERIDDTVVLTGDLHSSWAVDVAPDPWGAYDPASGRGSLAVEFVTPGISSPGLLDPDAAAQRTRDTLAGQPHVRWADFFGRGYALLDLDRDRARCEWWFVDGVAERGGGERRAAAWQTRRGDNHLEPAPG